VKSDGRKPLLLIDIDGPLNPYAAKATRRPAGYETHRVPMNGDRPAGSPDDLMTAAARRLTLRVWLNPAHGAMLLSLADVFELHWATDWEDAANRIVAPLIGLPELPVIHWGDYPLVNNRLAVLPPYEETLTALASERRRSVETLHWKTRPIAGYIAALGDDNCGDAGRAFVWMDDEMTDADRHHLGRVPALGPHLLHRIDPVVGMLDADIALMRDWAEAL